MPSTSPAKVSRFFNSKIRFTPQPKMHDKYIAPNLNSKTSAYLTNQLLSWLQDSHNVFKRLGDRLRKSIAKSNNLQFHFQNRFSSYKQWKDGKNYSFLIIDEDHNRAYVGGRDCPLNLHELIILPSSTGYEIYQVESVCLLSPDMWVSSVNKLLI